MLRVIGDIATATAIREIHQFMAQWRDRTTSTFDCEKTPVSATRGMAVTNHPLASAAALEIMAQGGNAVDATVAALFTLTVVEPMMVGIFGGGTAVIRLADGRELVIDGLATAPAMTRPDSYTPVSDQWPDYMETEGRANRVGAKAIAVPGNLMAWCEIAARFGKLDLPTLMEPAIRHAARGFEVTPYLATCIEETATDLALDPAIAAIFLPDGKPLRAGSRLVQSDYAATLRTIAQSGPGVMYGGELGRAIAGKLAQAGSFIRLEDLANYRTIEREPVRGSYRGVEIIGPPPPCSGGVHTIQILNILEAFDITASGFGTPQTLHLVLEALKIAAADRRAVTADPAFFDVPIAKLISKDYAKQRRAEIDPQRAGAYTSKVLSNESANTTHVTIADGDGNIVTSTQTINSLFGARLVIPGDRHHSQQLHVPVRSASGPGAVVDAGQAHHQRHLGADRQEGRQAAIRAWTPGRASDSVLRAAGGAQHRRSRHERAGSCRGAARFQLGVRGRSRARISGKRARRAGRTGARCRSGRSCRRRHVRHYFRTRRDHDGCRLLARRRRAGRDGWRIGARQHIVLAGPAPTQAEVRCA